MGIYYLFWAIIILPYAFFQPGTSKCLKRNYAIYVFICIAMLIGFKATSVGVDTVQYEYRYSIVEEMIEPGKEERGYSLFSFFFKQLGMSFQAYYFVVACVLSAALVFFYTSYSDNLAFSTLVFLTIGLLSMYMSGIRQSLAISFCLISLWWVDRHQGFIHLMIACAWVVIAYTFHVSAIVYLLAVVFVFLRIRLSRQGILILLIGATASLVYRDYFVGIVQLIIPYKYSSFGLYENYRINPLLIIISILIPLFCLMFDANVESDGKYSCQKTWMFVFSCVNLLLTILAQNSMYFRRMSYYFVHVNSLLIPNMIVGQKLKSNAYLMYIVLAIICMLYFIISTPGGTLQIDNYRFLWQQESTTFVL